MHLCVQIDEVLKDDNKCELLSAHVDQILVVCTIQLRMAYTKHMGDIGTDGPNNVIRLYKALIASLVSVSIWRLQNFKYL